MLIMAAVLDNLLANRILFDDFKTWILCDSQENSKERADFILYFLNFVKENCSWLLKAGKCLETTPLKVKSSSSKFSAQTKVEFQTLESTNVTNCSVSPHKTHAIDSNKNNLRFRQKDPNNRHDKRNSTGFFVMQEASPNEHNSYRKFDHSAKKSLNFNTQYHNKQNFGNQDIQSSVPDISNFDVFPPVGSNKRIQNDPKARRRITPTPVQSVQKGSSKFGNRQYSAHQEKTHDVFNRTSVVEAASSDLQNEREMLKLTRNQLSHSLTSSSNSTAIKNETCPNFENSVVQNVKHEISQSPKCSVSVQFVIPDPEKINDKNKLDLFSDVYELLVSYSLVMNITSELYFIFELITAKVLPSDKPSNEGHIFSSVHNCVFFGVSVLTKLKDTLNLLDASTLKSLCDIPYLPTFSVQLFEFLKTCRGNENLESWIKTQCLSRVPFILEEDSSENFIDNQTFTAFRKQRDLFYELLRDWEMHPIDGIDSKFTDSFSRKSKQLINFAPNSVNMHHLAKLFQNQLIASCLGLEVSEIYDELLSDIRKNFPGKFEKLQQRLVLPSFGVGGPSPPPSFYGTQAFFSQLIQSINSSSFNQHLQDTFISKILELNTSDLSSDSESNCTSTMKEKYVFLLHTLRLLGKFLGFVYFLPYKLTEPLSPNVLNHQLETRKQSVLPLNIKLILKSAIVNRNVILTVPWIVEFLSMADPVAKNLASVEAALEILTLIYRGKYIIPVKMNFWLLRLIIGWLFDVLNYSLKFDFVFQFDIGLKDSGLDFLALIDKQLLYSCCPYLVEFKILVFNFLNGIKKDKKEVRKIKPLTTTKTDETSTAEQQLQLQLEENFFFLQPPSLKKTVEFVSERIASKIIHKIRCEVTNFKLQAVESIQTEDAYKELLLDSANLQKKNLHIESQVLKLYDASRTKFASFLKEMCPRDVKNTLPILLPDDTRAPVLSMSCEICVRYAVDKINVWCETNLIFEDIKSDIKNKLDHLSKIDSNVTNDNDFNLSSLLSSLRELILQIYCGCRDMLTNLSFMLSEVKLTLNQPIGNSANKLIMFLIVDLYMSMLVNFPEKCNSDINVAFFPIWELSPKRFQLEQYFLGAQNVKLILTGKNFEHSCKALDNILIELLNNEVFCSKEVNMCLEKLKSYWWRDKMIDKLIRHLPSTISKLQSTAVSKS